MSLTLAQHVIAMNMVPPLDGEDDAYDQQKKIGEILQIAWTRDFFVLS